jgi:hypothetical protein
MSTMEQTDAWSRTRDHMRAALHAFGTRTQYDDEQASSQSATTVQGPTVPVPMPVPMPMPMPPSQQPPQWAMAPQWGMPPEAPHVSPSAAYTTTGTIIMHIYICTHTIRTYVELN